MLSGRQAIEGDAAHPEGSRQGYLEPDATLVARSGDDLWAVLIEYDRTERPHKQIDRLRRYDRWLLDGWRKGPFATHSIPPSVIFLTAREGPLLRLIETADQTFAAHGRRARARATVPTRRGNGSSSRAASTFSLGTGRCSARRACRLSCGRSRPSVSHASSSTTCPRSLQRLFVSRHRAAESAAQGVRALAGPPARVFGWVVVWGLRSMRRPPIRRPCCPLAPEIWLCSWPEEGGPRLSASLRPGDPLPRPTHHRCLWRGLRRAVVRGLIPVNPVSVVDKPRQPPTRRPQPLEPLKVESIRIRLRQRDATLVSMLAYAGLRPDEATSTRWADLGERILHVQGGQTERTRVVELLAPLAQDLAEWRLALVAPPQMRSSSRALAAASGSFTTGRTGDGASTGPPPRLPASPATCDRIDCARRLAAAVGGTLADLRCRSGGALGRDPRRPLRGRAARARRSAADAGRRGDSPCPRGCGRPPQMFAKPEQASSSTPLAQGGARR